MIFHPFFRLFLWCVEYNYTLAIEAFMFHDDIDIHSLSCYATLTFYVTNIKYPLLSMDDRWKGWLCFWTWKCKVIKQLEGFILINEVLELVYLLRFLWKIKKNQFVFYWNKMQLIKCFIHEIESNTREYSQEMKMSSLLHFHNNSPPRISTTQSEAKK